LTNQLWKKCTHCHRSSFKCCKLQKYYLAVAAIVEKKLCKFWKKTSNTTFKHYSTCQPLFSKILW